MSIDITALMATMKAAAENLDGDTWRDEGASVYGGAYDVGDNVCYDHIVDCESINGESLVAEFIAAVNPANVLVLVEALEKARQTNFTQREYYEFVIADGSRRIARLLEALEAKDKQIAEPEPRTVTVKRVGADQMHRVCLEATRHLDKYAAMAREVNKLLGSAVTNTTAAQPVTVKLPRRVGAKASWQDGPLMHADEVIAALAAAGIQIIEGEGQ